MVRVRGISHQLGSVLDFVALPPPPLLSAGFVSRWGAAVGSASPHIYHYAPLSSLLQALRALHLPLRPRLIPATFDCAACEGASHGETCGAADVASPCGYGISFENLQGGSLTVALDLSGTASTLTLDPLDTTRAPLSSSCE